MFKAIPRKTGVEEFDLSELQDLIEEQGLMDDEVKQVGEGKKDTEEE